MMKPLAFPTRLHLALRPTPLIALNRLSEQLKGPTIWLKRDDLTDMVASGNKLRKLEFALAAAKAKGADTVITYGGVQSNHCRATAIIGAQLGLKVHLLLRGEAPIQADGNLLIAHLAGATVQHLSVDTFKYDLDSVYQSIKSDYQHQGRTVYHLALGASDATGLWGYIDCARELKSDCEQHAIEPDHIVCATGSGGTLGGLIIGNAAYSLNAQVWGVNVCDDARYFIDKITQDFVDFTVQYPTDLDISSLPINIIDGYVGPGYAKADAPIYQLIRKIAQLEGIILDPVYTGKAFYALIQEIQRTHRFAHAKHIIFIHTGGLFGLFPHKTAIMFNESPGVE